MTLTLSQVYGSCVCVCVCLCLCVSALLVFVPDGKTPWHVAAPSVAPSPLPKEKKDRTLFLKKRRIELFF